MKGRLIQGKSYTFRVIKKITTDEGSACWILEDPFGYRQLLDASFYTQYPITPGNLLVCKVDKINCSGKIFLEPEHPLYKEGDVYDFHVITSFSFGSDFLVTVEDNNKSTHTLTMATKPSSIARCRVNRIKKGRLYLTDPKKIPDLWFVEGAYYFFRVSDIRNTPDCGECFFLLDEKQGTHILPAGFYKGYPITKGSTIQCKVVKQLPDGTCTLEPQHPVYIPGHRYQFPVVSLDFLTSYNGKKEYVLTVSTALDSTIQVPVGGCPKEFTAMVDCKVERIKKGKVFLIDPQPVR
ncbi:MAG: hypothetical protein PHU97_00965 [Bacteroidales bacterium]|nr:hypothetical protein [Bacteroidales bacterium]MDD2322341.1 hypothetical protein [Bacteroidales bacterium]MDD3009873.1 hypothetical protein [Bacteroidales bacterium]MDD3961480.1 hypothetical protein [Bacteroidales bacterium]MDY0285147.1 hypothetical protein [Bacteroidales bacterium]